MTLLKTFWTPIVVYPDVKTGCKFVAAYTIVSLICVYFNFLFKYYSLFLGNINLLDGTYCTYAEWRRINPNVQSFF